jgi:hypothetical protein
MRQTRLPVGRHGCRRPPCAGCECVALCRRTAHGDQSVYNRGHNHWQRVGAFTGTPQVVVSSSGSVEGMQRQLSYMGISLHGIDARGHCLRWVASVCVHHAVVLFVHRRRHAAHGVLFDAAKLICRATWIERTEPGRLGPAKIVVHPKAENVMVQSLRVAHLWRDPRLDRDVVARLHVAH